MAPGLPAADGGGLNRLILERLLSIHERISLTEEEALITGYFPDLTKAEMHTLAVIGPYEKRAMGETAAALNITTGTLTVAVDRLVKKAYVVRERAENDRRIVLLSLTRRGRVACRLLWRFHHLLVADIVADYTEEEKAMLLGMLVRVDDSLAARYARYSGQDALEV
ncbi:MAG: MarR family transcriptional regulator [Bacillota bacterium]|nr:MarR family transcriptional regulator [Bacillota bacterium]